MVISSEPVISSNMSGAGNENDVQDEEEKPRTLFVGNVPRDVRKREIEEIFGEVGPLKRCHIQYPRIGNEKRKQRDETTVAYITFALSQDAVKALETLQNTKIGDNRINIKFSKARSGQGREGAEGEGGGGGTVEDKYARFRKAAENPNFQALGGVEKPKPIKKKSRLIVRNLSFKVTEEKMKEYFEQCGEVKEVNILKKSNGKLVGCAFIQYSNVPQAAKAVKELNLKPFLGRPIAIDWALPKEKYQTEDEKNKKKEEKVEETEEDTIVIKDEPADVETQDEDGGALDHYDDLKEVEEIKQESEDKKAKRKRKLDDDESESDDDENDSDSDDAEQKYSPQKRQKQITNDVEEGKTLFLRNLSFDTSEELLKQFFGKYGQLHYALLCKDSLTEHPKGTGFVKFKEKSAADKCLLDHNVDPTNFKLSGRQFNISVALSRDKVGKKTPAEIKSEKPKSDTRNLYLVREGFIRPGSGAAVDVSASDMDKRASLNSVKKQMLKNLSIFISPTRLCVHNLPENYSDTQLRKLFKKFAGPGAVITEARVMRDMKNIQLDGKGKSKGFGFVNFKDHEHALVALRTVNNNPTVFKPTNRPIVEFSLENRSALKAKERRAQKSQEKNPNVKKQPKPEKMEIDEEDEDDDDNGNSSEEEEKVPVKQNGKKNQGKQIQAKVESDEEGSERPPNYAGLVAKKGVQSVPSFKPKGKITRNSLKTRKTKKKVQDRKKREAQVPSKRPIERIDKTEKIINRYQQKLSASSKSEGMKKKKWFDK